MTTNNVLAFDQMPVHQQQSILSEYRSKWMIDMGDAKMFVKPEWRKDYRLAMDAQPQLVTTANGAIPAFLSYFTDPDLLRILTSPNRAAEIYGEKQKGDWTTSSVIFRTVESTYNVSTYGDYNNNGNANVNANFPTRQPYNYQVITEYGDYEMERMGLAKIDVASEKRHAAVDGLNKFSNLAYFRGIAGLQNYGILTDPNLRPAISPAPKILGGVAWINGSQPNASTNEIYADIQGLISQLITQSGGRIDRSSKIVLAMSPVRLSTALTVTNIYGKNVFDLLTKAYPNLSYENAVQFGLLTPDNPQGNPAGEIVQAYCPVVDGQESGYCSFNMKLRAGPVIRGLSDFKQKFAQGTNGFILRQPFALATMIGV